jgi:Mrp family chromosome partitioning ATPase/capsular polysaccharide biosynthesis protein
VVQAGASGRRAGAGSVVFSAVWRARWLVLSAVLVAGVGGYLISKNQPSTFTSQGRIVFAHTQAFDPLGRQSFGDPARYLENQASVITSTQVLDIAATTLGVDPSLVGASTVVGTAQGNDVLTVAATGPTAGEAKERADAVMNGYAAYMQQRTDAMAAAALDGLPPTDTRRLDITTQATIYGDGIDVIEPAFRPVEPSSPVPVRDALLLAALALIVSVGLAVWRRGPAVDSSASAAAGFAPVFDVVPLRRSWSRRGVAVDPADYALTLVALDYARGETPGAVLVTGTAWDGGAASVVHGLAISAAARGRRVLVVDADPTSRALLQRAGGPEPHKRLESLGDGTAREADVLVPVLTADGQEFRLAILGDPDGGPVDDSAVAAALDRLVPGYDLVLLQTGPVADSPVAFALVRHADATVATIGLKDEGERLTALRDRLATAHKALSGIVLIRPTRTARFRLPARSAPAPQPVPAAEPVPAASAESRVRVGEGRRTGRDGNVRPLAEDERPSPPASVR